MNAENGVLREHDRGGHCHCDPASLAVAGESRENRAACLAIRSHTGLSGDMLLAGLATLSLARENIAPDSGQADECLANLCRKIMPEFAGVLTIRPRLVSGIRGWQACVDLPRAHEHRHLEDLLAIIEKSEMTGAAAEKARACFGLLAECEAAAHGIALQDVHFHEVGALDSILDVCAVCELYSELGEPELVCGPLPIADGQIKCDHGILPAPAPAVVRLLAGVPVRPFRGDPDAGELVTPTSLALLSGLKAAFGPWPAFTVKETSLVYGQREFAGVANGVIFALGEKA